MLDYFQNLLSLSSTELITALLVVFIAGIVRGFSGFALSALIMAGLTLTIPPTSLIPICILLEAVASALMIRSGFKNADRRIAWALAITSAMGMPLGLLATMSVSEDVSRFIALALIVLLALMQLLRKSPAFLGTKPGLYAAGLTAGIAGGLAGVAGMVVALFVLAQNAAPAVMRASLVMYLFLGIFSSVFWLTLSGLLDSLAITRGLFLAPVAIIGVMIGTHLFRPSLEVFYKRFCLGLLIFVAVAGLLRLAIG